MGNRLTVSAPIKEAKGPSERTTEFFQGVRVKWLDYFVSELKVRLGRSSSEHLGINDKTLFLKWKDFFSIFSSIQEQVDKERDKEMKSTWHPAVKGYVMEKDTTCVYTPILPPPPPGFPEGFTDDEPSDLSGSDSETEGQERPKPRGKSGERRAHEDSMNNVKAAIVRDLPDGWDPCLVNPMFYGYKITRSDEVESAKARLNEDIAQAEGRAIERAMSTRSSAIGEIERANKGREAARLKKIADIEAGYKQSQAQREAELARNRVTLPADALKMFKAQWDLENDAALEALDVEVQVMKNTNHIKTTNDRNQLLRKLEDLDAFRDAEAQDMPSAERLEQISRVELHYWIEELDKRTKGLEKARHEYAGVKAEVSSELVSANKQKANEARAMLNFAEAAVRTGQKELRAALEALNDAEILLSRAIRMKIRQDRLLPLFKLISGEEMPRACRFDLFFAALSVLVVGSFESKCDLVLGMVDSSGSGYLGLNDLYSTVYLFHDTLYRLKLVTLPPNEEELKNVLFRSFFERGLSLSDSLTQYEAKMTLAELVSHSAPAAAALGVYKADSMCTYQRNRMSPLSLLSLGLIGPATAKYRTHYGMSVYRPQLEPSKVQFLHERAFLMGDDDPNRPDYSRFVETKEARKRSNVTPLTHGHLNNRLFIEVEEELYAVVRIQSLFRSRRDRRIAEVAAKRQAFTEAQEYAAAEMKKKIMEEFRNRETGFGVGKLKWDAQVRMRQAKVRTGGLEVNRSETVMIMMEEAIGRAMEEIESKFSVIAEKEGYAQKGERASAKAVAPPEDALGMFGLVQRPAVHDTDAVVDKIDTPRPDEEEGAEEGAGEDADQKAERQQKINSSFIQISPEAYKSIVRGVPLAGQSSSGETAVEKELRLAMSSSSPSLEQLGKRLMALDPALSGLRTNEMLSSVPSKRLLLQFIEASSEEEIARQLASYYGITKNVAAIASIFKMLVKSDAESGRLGGQLDEIKSRVDVAAKALLEKELRTRLPDLEKRISSRLKSSVGAVEAEIIKEESNKLRDHILRFREDTLDTLAAAERLNDKYRKSMLSILELERRKRCVDMLGAIKAGNPVDVDVTIEARQSWMKRLNSAMSLPERSPAEVEGKYSEIRLVGREFLEYATADAQVIVSEFFQPRYKKTIRISGSTAVDGHSKHCGRGLDGQSVVFEAHNISYRVCIDDNGVFNGSDEHAAKAGANERLGSLQYLKTHTKKLNIPLIATIDYFGFRILAVSKLDCEEISFNDEGEVRKISEDLVHGATNRGNNFVNKNKTASALLKRVGGAMNLMEHVCKGLRDASSSSTASSGEIKVYRRGDQFYAKDFWLAMPAEHSSCTPHLPAAPREQSVFWRLLRPEFVKHFRLPLSPNAFNALTITSPDRDQQLENLRLATESLLKETIPSFLSDMSCREFLLPLSQGLGVDISSEFHCRGINIRHIGLMRSALFRKLPGFCKLFFDEDFVRTTRDLRDEVAVGDVVVLAGVSYDVLETKERPITHSRIPISTKYLGEPAERLEGTAGASFMKAGANSELLRSLFLAEMVARAVKAMVKLMLRSFVRKAKGASPEFLSSLYCEYFNVITGAHPRANLILQEDVFERIREMYGPRAVRLSERDNLQLDLQPTTVYIVNRLQSMLGIQLSFACVGEFNERPIGFVFCRVDFLQCAPVVRHNMPFMVFAEAQLVTLSATQAEGNVYESLVKGDGPALYFRLQERKGARELVNSGDIPSNDLMGKLSTGCVLERAGPIPFDPFSRSILFDPDCKSRIESKFHPSVVPTAARDHFSVELYAKATGGSGTRCALSCGRYSIQCNRENQWVFVFIEGIHEIYLRIAPVAPNQWVHLSGTFDGTTLRCYKNSILQSSLEVAAPLQARIDERLADLEAKRAVLRSDEHDERELQKTESIKEGEKYFKSREGSSAMKSAMKTIMESYDFQSRNIGLEEKDASSAARLRKTEALKQARQDYITELYIKNVHEISARFASLLDEVNEEAGRDAANGLTRSKRGLRIGAGCAAAAPNHFFHGYLAHVAVYPLCLSADRIAAHHLAGSLDRTKDAQRLHAVASARYEEALMLVADDPVVLRSFASSLCRLLRIELSAASSMGVSRGKVKVLEAVHMFKKLLLPEGIGEILMALPREAEFANIVCEGLLAIFEMDSLFFSRNKSMTRADLVHLPAEFALALAENPPKYLHVAAAIYQEVSRDTKLAKNYGEVDFSFLPYIKTPELVVSLVQCIREDASLHVVNVGEMFRSVKQKDINIVDDDVQVLAENLPLAIGFDLSYSSLLTNACMEHVSRLSAVRIIILEGCLGFTDGCIDCIAEACSATLEVLSLAGNRNISDNCFTKIVQRCRNLTLFNVGGCPNITHLLLLEILRNNKKMNTLLVSATYITDEGLSLMTTSMSSKFLTSLDLSFCREISDSGILSLSEKCTSLSSLNLCGLNRVTDEAARSVCANCWSLKTLSLEDVFLLDDAAFWFDRVRDGRRVAGESMLTSLTSLSLRDCINISDRALEGLSERCRQLEVLTLRGCEKLTSNAMRALIDPCHFKVGMCDSLLSLDLSYCSSVATSSILDMLAECACLEELFLEGIVGVNDDFVHQMCISCRTITKLCLQRCQSITDASLCSIADFLWMEMLDISHCTKISDPAVETLSLVCNAIQDLKLRRCNKLTSQSLLALVRNCRGLREVDIRDCPLILDEAVADTRKFHVTLTILK